MTKASANLRAGTPLAPAGPAHRVAALHAQGDRWRLVVGQNRDGFTILEARTLAAGDTAELDASLHRHKVGRLVRVAPGPQTLCRCAAIPQADAPASAAALRLLAEAQLPDSVPPHRRAAGTIPDRAVLGMRTGLLTAWPPRPDQQPAAATRVAPESWSTEVAALAFLRGSTGGLAAYAAPGSGGASARGSIAVLVSGPQRTLARLVLEDAASGPAWTRAVEGTIRETVTAAGAEAAVGAVNSGGPSLLLGAAAVAHLGQEVRALPSERRWLDEYGIALGAALAAVTPDSCARALTELLAEEPREHGSPLERTLTWLSIPRNAYITIAAALLIMLLGPMAFAAARLGVLNAKASVLTGGQAQRTMIAQRAALYRQLEQTRWPITKLLADVAGATPVGVVVESLRVSQEQGLSIEGTAKDYKEIKASELVNTLEQNLNKTGVFAGVKIDRAESTAAGVVEFSATARVAGPQVSVKPIEDFAAEPLAKRLYGEGATNTAAPLADSGDKGAAGGDHAARRRGGEHNGTSESGAKPSPRGAPAGDDKGKAAGETKSESKPASKDAPAELTEAQIGAMDAKKAMAEWTGRRKYLNENRDADKAVRERIEGEIEKLKAQQKAAGAKAAGTAPATSPAPPAAPSAPGAAK